MVLREQKDRGRYANGPRKLQQLRERSLAISDESWRAVASKWAKRALRAEAMLARHEGPIG